MAEMIQQFTDLPDPVIMILDPKWFRTGYYIYVVHMRYGTDDYFYIGMTGDRYHIVARSPFYRMNGHFSKSKLSTQSQIYKGLEKHTAGFTEATLCEIHITYYAWMLNEFDADDIEGHKCKRIYGESVENNLIQKMRNAFGRRVFNRGSQKDYPNSDTAQNIFNEIMKRFIAFQN